MPQDVEHWLTPPHNHWHSCDAYTQNIVDTLSYSSTQIYADILNIHGCRSIEVVGRESCICPTSKERILKKNLDTQHINVVICCTQHINVVLLQNASSLHLSSLATRGLYYTPNVPLEGNLSNTGGVNHNYLP